MAPDLCPVRHRVLGFVHCYPTSDRLGLEFSTFLRVGGLVSPAEFASMIGRIFPIALSWSIFVIVSTPSLQLFASILQRQELMGVQTFAAQLAVERLGE
ncbi:hypothetical protein JCM17846_33370 [Iodidimonas nitroreducens]|uniref:Uncharacterized protein n=1 Tax=Iodidimonas nitroreducens TaxID=1236968 RepID=A0A5A7NDF2_9PROT|nr:hypothetical protein JCM17846_33370 [Iodidimonas nitroreducens]